MKRGRGNPKWTSAGRNYTIPNEPTLFERQVVRLGLRPDELAASDTLRQWAYEHRNSNYVPTDLLRTWGIREGADEF